MMSEIWSSFKLSDYLTKKVKLAISLPELVSQTNSFSVKNRPGCVPHLEASDPKDLFLRYNVKCNLETSDPNGHDVKVHFDVSKVTPEMRANDLDIKVNCSCVALDSMIRMADGTEKRIDEVSVGDHVITHKGRAKKVTAVSERKPREGEQAWEVKAKGYQTPLILSEDHPIAVVRGRENCACGCGAPLWPTSGKYSSVVKKRLGRNFLSGHNTLGNTRLLVKPEISSFWKTPLEIVDRETLYFPKFAWTGTKVVDPDLAALTGYYLAEGCLHLHKRRSTKKVKAAQVVVDGEQYSAYEVTFTYNRNEKDTVVKDTAERARRYLGPNARIEIEDNSEYSWINVRVKDSQFAKQMYELCGQGSLTKRLSEEILAWDVEAMWNLISSHALGDGNIEYDTQDIVSYSRNLLQQISFFLFSQGVWQSFTNTRLRISYRQYPALVLRMFKWLRERDKERVEKSLGKVFSESRDLEWREGFLRCLNYAKQVSCPPSFFDLTVEEDESFIANGVVVHNCPAFLYWGNQWNLHERDALEGEPRPKLQAPKERLDLRTNALICKHIKAVCERILPAVQHNIQNLVREKVVEEYKQTPTKAPTRLDREQEAMRQRQLLKKKRRTPKEKEDLEDMQRKERDRLLQEEAELDEQTEREIERTAPAAVEAQPTPAEQKEKLQQPRKEEVHVKDEEESHSQNHDLIDQMLVEEKRKLEEQAEGDRKRLKKMRDDKFNNWKKNRNRNQNFRVSSLDEEKEETEDVTG